MLVFVCEKGMREKEKQTKKTDAERETGCETFFRAMPCIY